MGEQQARGVGQRSHVLTTGYTNGTIALAYILYYGNKHFFILQRINHAFHRVDDEDCLNNGYLSFLRFRWRCCRLAQWWLGLLSGRR